MAQTQPHAQAHTYPTLAVLDEVLDDEEVAHDDEDVLLVWRCDWMCKKMNP